MISPDKKITVLHVTTPLSWRGGEQQMAYLVQELKKKGIRLFVLCSAGSAVENFCLNEKIPFFTSVKKGGFDLSYARKIRKICKEEKVSIIHTHDSHAHSFAILAALVWGNKTKIIVSRRVDFPVRNSLFSRFKYNHPSVARIICVSEKIKEITALAIRDPKKLVTVHSGVEVKRFEGKTNTGILQREFHIPAGKKIIGNVAALAPHKDHFTFVDTAFLLNQMRQDCMFILIGDGPEKEKIISYISEKGMKDKIILTGFRKDVPDILPELDTMLITSETEGLGTSILDAFACRVPVVATNAGGIPEIVIHEKTGLLAPVKDAAALAKEVNRLLNDTTLRETVINGALLHLQQFTCEATAKKTLEMYMEILK